MSTSVSAHQRLAELGLSLPKPGAPKANYAPIVRSGNHLFVSGQLSEDENGLIKGRCGEELSLEDGARAARACALMLLAQIEGNAGIVLDDVVQVVKLTVMVNSTPDFTDHPAVANGASDLMVAVFGDRGRHARAAYGVAALPLGAAVEIEAIIEL